MDKQELGRSGIAVAPLALGGNVFGWTADEAMSFRVLDAFVDAGFNLVDTADVYSIWVDGHEGGESETVTLQPWYNLYDRVAFEGPLQDLCRNEELGMISYFGLAAGFLTGKYRAEKDLEGRPRAGLVKRMMNERGFRILAALDEAALECDATPARVALAWLRAHGVTAPIASATSPDQLAELVCAATLELEPETVAKLDAASEGGEPPPSW